MIILRAFQVINKDGQKAVSATYNEVNERGEIIRTNAKDSFYAVDSTLQGHIDAIETFIVNRLQQ